MPNCDYPASVSPPPNYLIPLIVKLVPAGPAPASNYGLSKATTRNDHLHTKSPKARYRGRQRGDARPPTVDAVGDVTITYSDWCTTPSCTDSTNPPAMSRPTRAGRIPDVRLQGCRIRFRTYSTDRANFLMRTEPQQPRSTGCRRRMSDSKSGSLFRSSSARYNVGDKTQLVTEAYDGYEGPECGLHPARQVHVVESRSGVGRLQRKTHRTVPGTATITARYDWSIPLGGKGAIGLRVVDHGRHREMGRRSIRFAPMTSPPSGSGR